jgi:hypothetical protein
MRKWAGIPALSVLVVLLPALVGAACTGAHTEATRARLPGAAAAFVAGGTLQVVTEASTSTSPVLRTIPASGEASEPAWSFDGAWLAYAVTPSATPGPLPGGAQVHVVRADGTGDRIVPGAGPTFAWSPSADVLGFIAAGGAALEVAPPGGAALPLVDAGSATIDSFVWSAGGSALAYSLRPAGPVASDQLFSVSADGGRFQRSAYLAPAGSRIILAGSWPDGQGVVAWVGPDPGSGAGLPLMSVGLGSATGAGAPSQLAVTLVYRPWLAWAPGGGAFVAVAGSDPSPGAGKSLLLCRFGSGSSSTSTASAPGPPVCAAIAQPPGVLSVDPAWSRGGNRIAFVRAPEMSPGEPAGTWYTTRRLWVASADGSGAHEVPGAGGGAAAPSWLPGDAAIGVSGSAGPVVVAPGGGSSRSLTPSLAPNPAGVDPPVTAGKQPWGGLAVWSPS